MDCLVRFEGQEEGFLREVVVGCTLVRSGLLDVCGGAGGLFGVVVHSVGDVGDV